MSIILSRNIFELDIIFQSFLHVHLVYILFFIQYTWNPNIYLMGLGKSNVTNIIFDSVTEFKDNTCPVF